MLERIAIFPWRALTERCYDFQTVGWASICFVNCLTDAIFRLVLTRIRMQQCQKQVLKVLQRIRDLGVILETADDALNAPTISEAFHRMLPDPFDGFSDTLNVDTTLLIAFISDMTHDKLQSKDWHNRNITDQITREAKKPLLPSHLWPACGSRKLVCTHEAADRALEIVATSRLSSILRLSGSQAY